MASETQKIEAEKKPAKAAQLKETSRRVNGQTFRLNDLLVDTLADLIERVERLEEQHAQRVVKVRT